VRRRDFIALACGAALSAGGQHRLSAQPAMPVIGFLRSASLAPAQNLVSAFRRGLRETDFVEGESVAIELRSAEDDPERLPALVAELIQHPVAVIVGNVLAALAAKAATTTVPIVFATGADPIRDGLVASVNRPGGNVTGVVFISSVLGAKRLELLHQLVPKVGTIGVLVNPGSPNTEAERKDVQAAARAKGSN
jgi:putative ABC transport system substrate-binding protein